MKPRNKDAYRKVYRGKGHGVHSPFAYNLITKVIEEGSPYYCFPELNRARKELIKMFDSVFSKKYIISQRRGELFFRLANYVKSHHFLLVGSSIGTAALYLTAYSKETHCVSLEEVESQASSWIPMIQAKARTPIDFRIGDYSSTLPSALQEFEKLDFILINPHDKKKPVDWMMKEFRSKIYSQTVMVVEGIHRTAALKSFWRICCEDPDVSVTIDLDSFGIVFFDQKLHKQNYISTF